MDPIVLFIIEVALLIVTGLAALAALVQARTAVDARDDAQTAQAESEKARDEAVRLAREANAALVRQAEAQERTASATEAATPRPTVRWGIIQVRKHHWIVRNDGGAVARQARIWDASNPPVYIFNIEDGGPRDVGPGDFLSFRHMQTGGGGRPIVGIASINPDTGLEEEIERKLV
jgi:hypothetical protein